MFTGLIEEVGEIVELSRNRATRRLTVSAPRVARKLAVGDSIAVSGVCLTAVEMRDGLLSADLAQETVARTSFSSLKPGAKLNLELPRAAGAKLDGHMVQGHVDGVGKLLSLEPAKSTARNGGKPASAREDWWLRAAIPKELAKYVVEKGSITIEGISLTVAQISENEVAVAIIPHTYSATNLRTLKPGAPLNIEVDVLAKYAEKRQQAGSSARITLERLVEEGF